MKPLALMVGIVVSAMLPVCAQNGNLGSVCTENVITGCVGTFTLTTTGGKTITVNVASDGVPIFPFGTSIFKPSSDGIKFTLPAGVTVTNLSPAWTTNGTPNVFIITIASIFTSGCGLDLGIFGIEPSCEPVGDFVLNVPLTSTGFYTIAGDNGGISDYIAFGNTGPNGNGEVKFYSDPNRPPASMLVRYASNLNVADSVINVTNSGDSATAQQALDPPNAQNNINGSICVNIYAFAADEQEVACCSCYVTPNGLNSLSVKTALLNSTLTAAVPNEVVIKMIATVANPVSATAAACNPSNVNIGLATSGLKAWGTTVHGFPTAAGPTFSVSETPFLNATLSDAELQRVVQECQFIQILGSGQFGICKGCSNVGLGAAAQ